MSDSVIGLTSVPVARELLRDREAAIILVQFAGALLNAGAFEDDGGHDESMRQLLYFFEKPHKWAREFLAWDRCGLPQDEGEPHWEEFVAAVGQGGD